MQKMQHLPVDIQYQELFPVDKVSKHRPAESWNSPRRHASSRSYTNPSIRVTNALRDKDALILLLDHHGRHCIEKMAFCIRPRCLDVDRALQVDGGQSVISPAAQDLLSGRLMGPNLRHIDIECDFDVETKETAKFEQDVSRAFLHPKDEETLLQLEAEDSRRRLLAETWTALAKNSTVRELSIDRFVPIWTSAFHSTNLQELLCRLESLHINIFGSKNGHRGVNTVPAYIDSLQSILKVMFLHGGSLKQLFLHASQHAPLGARGHYHIPLSLKATQLPQLQHLSLKNCFIGFELAHFINSHANTLKTLELRNCYSYRGPIEGECFGGMAWAPFLAMITRREMKLQRFEIHDDYIPLTIDDIRLAVYDPETAYEPRDVKNVRHTQKRRPKLRLFLYAFLRDYSGELWMNKEAILASFDAEDDQKAFDQLMEVVLENQGGSQDKGGAGSEKHHAVDIVEVVELPA